MITISEVRLKDAERAYQEFFREEFRSKLLGSFGHWMGRGQEMLGLENPVTLATFRNLVNGLTPDGGKRILQGEQDPNRVALWQIDFGSSKSISALWAVSPGTYRARIESAHITAAMAALEHLDMRVINHQRLTDHVATLVVFFESGASHDQSPHLKATMFVLAHGFNKDGSTQKLTADDLPYQKERMQVMYDFHLKKEFMRLIGPFQRSAGIEDMRIVGVPQELGSRLAFAPAFNRDFHSKEKGKPLESGEFFARWRAQGESLGWGVNHAKALLRESKRQKYWEDLKSGIRLRIREKRAQLLLRLKESWKPSTKSQEPQQQERTPDPKVKGHRHSH